MPKVCSASQGCDREAVARNLCQKHYKQWLRGRAPITPGPSAQPPATTSYDDVWERFRAYIGERRQRAVFVPKESKGSRVRYGVISDLHVPFHDEDAVIEAVEWLAMNGATRLVVAGDFCDLYSLSRFVQYEQVPIRDEFIAARTLLHYFARTFAHVTILGGNHESRERKYLAQKLPSDLLDWFLERGILARVAQDMKNVEVVTRTIADTRMGWLAPIGEDCIVGHPEVSSRVPLKPAETFRLWLNDWHEEIGVSRPRLVIIGHTHQAGIAWVGSTQVVENGCLCRIQGYALEPRLYSRPQRLACTMFDQADGITDPNSVRQYYPMQTALRAA